MHYEEVDCTKFIHAQVIDVIACCPGKTIRYIAYTRGDGWGRWLWNDRQVSRSSHCIPDPRPRIWWALLIGVEVVVLVCTASLPCRGLTQVGSAALSFFFHRNNQRINLIWTGWDLLIFVKVSQHDLGKWLTLEVRANSESLYTEECIDTKPTSIYHIS